jgi:dTDP-4-dehydrorhamnose reductase
MRAMIAMLLIQSRATVSAMGAIRRRLPWARLVQTEDAGKTFSTPALASQADFDNERRWLSLDLLCGAVRPGHPLWDYFAWIGVDPDAFAPFADHPCPPDLIGLNYYVTGERFLDERIERYPAWTHGGNDRQRFADLEAVRVRSEGLFGARRLLGEAWRRFRIPLAITEAHLGAPADEQIRWLEEMWQSALGARADGVDVAAVTIWSLLGAVDWHCLVTRAEGRYEAGIFDVRSGTPVATEAAAWARARARGKRFDHPALETPGWWRLPGRLLYASLPPARDAELAHAAAF